MPVTYLRKAQVAELETVINIIEDAKKVLKNRGVNLWQDGYPDESVLRDDLERGIAYFLIKDGKIAGVAALEQGTEQSYEDIEDGEWMSDSRPVYSIIHRIAIASGHQGEGLSSIFIQHLLSISSALGYSDVRIDTHFDNLAMRHVIEKNGFEHRGTIYVEDHAPRIAYQRFI